MKCLVKVADLSPDINNYTDPRVPWLVKRSIPFVTNRGSEEFILPLFLVTSPLSALSFLVLTWNLIYTFLFLLIMSQTQTHSGLSLPDIFSSRLPSLFSGHVPQRQLGAVQGQWESPRSVHYQPENLVKVRFSLSFILSSFKVGRVIVFLLHVPGRWALATCPVSNPPQ
jgi:hypothetical protein